MSGKGEWVNLRFPNAFAHPFSFQGRDGGTRERMLVTIPKGVVLGDGRDVGGWNLSVRATPWALAQKRAGRPVSIGLRVGRSVELFKGRGPRRVTLRLDGPEGLRSALDEHRNVMSARVAVPADPGRGCRGSLDDAAPPMDGPAGDEGMLLFNDLAFDSGFVARMDTLASRFADDFAHGRYDAGTALRETRSLVAEAAMLMETVTVIWRRGGRLRRESRAVRGDRRGQRICRRSRGSERLRSAGRGREPRGTLRGSPCAARYAAVPAHVHHRVRQDR